MMPSIYKYFIWVSFMGTFFLPNTFSDTLSLSLSFINHSKKSLAYTGDKIGEEDLITFHRFIGVAKDTLFHPRSQEVLS